MPEQPIDPGDVERVRHRIRQLVAEISQLADADIAPQQFYGEFLQRVVLAVAAKGGALWSRESQNPPRLRLEWDVDFRTSGLLDEASGAGGHVALLNNAFNNGHAKLVPPRSGAAGPAEREAGSNSSDWSLILAPLQVDKQTLGVVELLMDPERRQTALDNAVKFVSELCEIGAGYLKNRQLRQMLGQQHLWSQLESFVRQIHSSLNPKEVSYIVANEGKRLVGCDRLNVAVVYGRKAVIEAVSGQEVIERKSTLVQLMTRLVNAVIRSKENLLYTGEELEGLPPAVHDALDDYLAESGTKILAVTLLRRKPTEEGTPGEPFGALIGEQLQDATAVGNISQRMDVVAQHATITLDNALAHYRVFMLPVWRTVGNATEWMRGNRLVKVAIAVGGIAAVTAAMIFVPMELRMEGKGELVPDNRQGVFAAEDGVVDHVDVSHGQMVTNGQILLRMRSEPLELEKKTIFYQLEEANARLSIAGAGTSPDAGGAMALAEAALLSGHDKLDLVQKRIGSLAVRSPLSGMIATWEPKRKLANKPVKLGDELLSVSQLDGEWILEVKMPEHKIGHIREAEQRRKARGDEKPLTAWFILASHPQKQFRGSVETIASVAEFDQDDKEHIVMVRVTPDDAVAVDPKFEPMPGFPDKQQLTKVTVRFKDGTELPLNPGAEIRAKVDCGKRAMGYVLLRELIEFVYETIIF